jgi:hypothetical protein
MFTTRSAAVFCALLIACFGIACAGPETELGFEFASLGEREATLHFTSDWQTRVEGELVAGGVAHLDYDPSRARCTSSQQGRPAWTVTAHYRINGGEIRSIHAAGHAPAPDQIGLPIELTQAGNLELWFENTDVNGCREWDSAYGANYRFEIALPANAPGWIGNGAYVIDRMTCNGPCDHHRRSLEDGWRYDTYARQRAAIRAIYFDVWKEGVTDFDNHDLWRQLDVQVHYRARENAPFTSRYVSFFRRSGNDARYELPMAEIDPLAGAYARTDPSQCPAADLTPAPDGVYVSATVEYYFTVNGAIFRRADGTNFRGVFEDYRPPFEICISR